MKKSIILVALLSTGMCIAKPAPADSQFDGYEDSTKTINGVLAPIGSGFNYQGELIDAGVAANGNYDFAFELFDALTGGSQIGGNVTKLNRTVTNGLISIEDIDFGDSAYSGDELWLSVTMRETGDPGSETTLSPRQKIGAVPYAVQAEFLAPNGAANGDILQFNGSDWVPSAISGGSSPWTTNGSHINFTTGHVGIGTANTTAGLVVDVEEGQGDIFRARIGLSATGGITKFYVDNNGGANVGSYDVPPVNGLRVQGDVKQPLSSDGMMKYMVSANCSNTNASIDRSYNGATNGTITATNGTIAGSCNIIFPDNITQRYFQVSPVRHGAVGVSCTLDLSTTDLQCFRFNSSTGAGFNGPIMVLVY